MPEPKRYRGIVIDPIKQIIEVVPTTASLEEIHTLVNAPTLDSFRIAEHEPTGASASYDYGWIDDGGLSRGEPIHAFLFANNKDPIAGRCLIIGCEKNSGNTCDAKLPLEFLRHEIMWLGKIKPEVFWDETETGSRAIVTYSRVQ